MWDIFEQPWTMVMVTFAVMAVIAVVGVFWPSTKRWWRWLLPLAIAIAGFGLDRFVETDREKVVAVIETAVKAVEEEDAVAFSKIVTEDYRDSVHRTRRNLMIQSHAWLSKDMVEKNILTILSTENSSTEATVVFTVRILFDKKSMAYQNFKRLMLVKVKANLRKQFKQRWMISRVELLELDRQPFSWSKIGQW